MKEKGLTPAALAAGLSGNFENFLVASTPGGIERQEAQGQQDFVTSETLPKNMIHGCTKEKLESMGIVFGEEADDIFIYCQLPEGWKKVPTDHSMWSKLVDEKGRKRAAIFYKAAFYDRNAHITLSRRFSASYIPEDRYKDPNVSYEEQSQGMWYGIVTDGGKEIFITKGIKNPSYNDKDELYAQAMGWLVNKYPDWQNELAYWD